MDKKCAVDKYFPKGVDPKYWWEVAKENGISFDSWRHRIMYLGWNYEDASTLPQGTRIKTKVLRKKDKRPFYFWKKINGEWIRDFEIQEYSYNVYVE